MASNPIKIGAITLIATIGLLVAAEAAAWWSIQRTAVPPLAVLGLTRLIQIAAMLLCVYRLEGGLAAIGWAPATWGHGLKKGVYWSLGFALAATVGMVVVFFAGWNPFVLLRTPLPSTRAEMILLFLVGGWVAPLAEEICFRGVLFTFFRRWGVWVALLASTAIFVALHSVHGIPVTQIIGGIVFALAYETSRNLMVPITIHVLGNTAIFALSLPMLRG
jgi:membrane protease YdiL (CAAX protease family)